MEGAGITADHFILLDVPDEILVGRVVGRRLDPGMFALSDIETRSLHVSETGKIYHLTYAPPPDEIKDRLIHRSDDTEVRLVVAVLSPHVVSHACH